MKKVIVITICLMALLAVSCDSLWDVQDEAKVNFEVSKETLEELFGYSSSGSQREAINIGDTMYVSLHLDETDKEFGGKEVIITENTQTIEFTGIPTGKKLYAKVLIETDVFIKEGVSKTVRLQEGKNYLSIEEVMVVALAPNVITPMEAIIDGPTIILRATENADGVGLKDALQKVFSEASISTKIKIEKPHYAEKIIPENDLSTLFANWLVLTSIEGLENIDTSKVTNMSQMFYFCAALKDIDVSNFDTSKVTNMDSMFYDCGVLAEVDVSDFDTSNVTNMAAMFSLCEALETLDLSNFNTSKVEDMSNMFEGCSELTELDLSNFDTKNVIKMESMFKFCSRLEELDITGWDTAMLTNVTDIFSGCDLLKPPGLTHDQTSGDLLGAINGL